MGGARQHTRDVSATDGAGTVYLEQQGGGLTAGERERSVKQAYRCLIPGYHLVLRGILGILVCGSACSIAMSVHGEYHPLLQPLIQSCQR